MPLTSKKKTYSKNIPHLVYLGVLVGFGIVDFGICRVFVSLGSESIGSLGLAYPARPRPRPRVSLLLNTVLKYQ